MSLKLARCAKINGFFGVWLGCCRHSAGNLEWSSMKHKILSDSLKFMMENQVQPSEPKVFLLKSTSFKCVKCLHWLIRCEDCISLVSVATKELW